MKNLIQKILLRKNQVLLGYAVTLICFGMMLIGTSVGIDEHIAVFSTSWSDPYIESGRFGLRLFLLLFSEYGRYAPFFWDILALTCAYLSGVVLYFTLFEQESSGLSCFAFCTIYATVTPIWADFYAFSQQSFPIALVLLMESLVVYGIRKNLFCRKGFLILMIFCGTFAVSVYQALAGALVTQIAALCFVKVLKRENIKKELLFGIFLVGVSCVLYLLLNKLVKCVCHTDGVYLENYIGWTTDSQGVFHALFMALANVFRVSFAITISDVEIYGGVPMAILSAVGIISVLIIAIREKSWKILLFGALLFCAPFGIYILLGTYKTHGRMLLGLPLVISVWAVLLLKISGRKFLHRIVALLFALMLLSNGYYTNRLYYSDKVVRERDARIISQLMHDIEAEGIDVRSKPLVLIGQMPVETDQFESYETVGGNGSLFLYNDGFLVQSLIEAYNIGYAVQGPNGSQIIEGYEASKAIESIWPEAGSILETENLIIVKLSEPTAEWKAANGIAE